MARNPGQDFHGRLNFALENAALHDWSVGQCTRPDLLDENGQNKKVFNLWWLLLLLLMSKQGFPLRPWSSFRKVSDVLIRNRQRWTWGSQICPCRCLPWQRPSNGGRTLENFCHRCRIENEHAKNFTSMGCGISQGTCLSFWGFNYDGFVKCSPTWVTAHRSVHFTVLHKLKLQQNHANFPTISTCNHWRGN